MEPVIGIDLGTTFSCVAIIKPNGKPKVIANFDGKNLIRLIAIIRVQRIITFFRP